MELQSNINIQFADLEYETKIERIYHISDIHIKLQKRHDEYRKVFSNLYKDLKEDLKLNLNNQSSKGVIVLTGDILHSKTELSPECVSITAEFFQNLSKIMPLIIIAGNHDANLNNNNRLDSLTPIVEKIIHKSQCYYLRQSGFYRFSNIIFGLTSVFDYNFSKAEDIAKINNLDLELEGIEHKISLFHGRIDGAITDTGAIMEGEKGINKKSFDGYDYTLLGDIHKHQFLIPNKMAYAGSLIQQNHGETLHNHGFIIWDLKNKKVEFKEVYNEYGFITLKIKKGKLLKNKSVSRIPNKCYLRLEIDNLTSRDEQQIIINDFKEKRTILELIQTNSKDLEESDEESDDDDDNNEDNNQDNQENNGENGENNENSNETLSKKEKKELKEKNKKESNSSLLRSLSFNVSNHQFQNSEIEKYLISKKVSSEMIEKVKKINTEYNQQVLVAETLLGGSWKLKTLEFSNLFCYGLDNFIDFTKSKGIVGLVAPNHSGKSSILDIILYTLFDKTSRKGTSKDILRLGEKSYKCKLEIEMGDKLFVINKKGNKKLNDVMSNTVDFYYYVSSKNEAGKVISTKNILSGKTPAETRKIIETYFGTFDDMVMTSISLQNNNTQFADSTSAEKRKEFEKLLRIDIFERLKELSMESTREKKAIVKHITSEIPENVLKNLLEEHLTLSGKMKEIEEELSLKKENLTELQQTESGLMIRLSSSVNQIPSQYKEIAQNGQLEKTKETLLKNKEKLYKDINSIENNIKVCLESISSSTSSDENLNDNNNNNNENLNIDLKTKFSNIDINEWKINEETRKNKIKEIQSKINTLSRSFHNINSTQKETENETENENKSFNKKEKLEQIDEKVKKIEEIEKEKESNLELVFKLRQKIKKLKECDFEEKEMVSNLFNQVLEKQVLEHHRKGKLIKFYDDLKENINGVLDAKYQVGNLKDLQKEEDDLKKINKVIEKNIKLIESLKEENLTDAQLIKDYNLKIKLEKENAKKEKENIEENAKIQLEIDALEKTKRKLEKNQFDIEGYMKYQNIIKKENEILKLNNDLEKVNLQVLNLNKELDDLEMVFENLAIYSKTHMMLNNIMKEILEHQTIVEELEEERGNMKGSLGVIETEMKTLKDKKKKMENLILELDVLVTYQDCLKTVPFIIIDKIIPQLERTINQMLSSLVNFSINFNITEKDLNVYISRPHGQIPLSNASGFEKFVGSLFLRIGLIKISNLPKANFLAIDEGWSNFDYDNMNNVSMIMDYLRTEFDFVILVSHLQTMREQTDQQININVEKKENEIFSLSSIKNAF